MPAAPQMQAMMDRIEGRITGILTGNVTMSTMALALLIVKKIQEQHPAQLSEADKDLVWQNCPTATEEDFETRSLSDEGLRSVTTLFQTVSAMVMSYSPSTNIQAEAIHDTDDEARQEKAQAIAEKAYSDLKALGYTPFGAAATMSCISSVSAIEDGTPILKMARGLNDLLGECLRG